MPKVLRADEVVNKQPWLPQPMESFEPQPCEVEENIDPQVLLAESRARAHAEAEAILVHARDDAERLRREAYQEGQARGEEQGFAAATHRYDEKMAELTTLVEEINRERDTAFERVEADLVRLSTVIAEKLIAQELTLKPEIVVELVRTHMKRIRDREVLRIRIHPEDMAAMSEARHALLSEVDGVREIQLYDDRRIARGSAVIEAESGSLDARFSSQMTVVTNALEETLEVPQDAQDD